MPGEQQDDLPPEVRRAIALIETFRATAPTTMPVPQNRESGEEFDRRMTARRPSDGRDLYHFPPRLRDFFDDLDKEDIESLRQAVKLRPDTLRWIGGKSDDYLGSLDQIVRDYGKVAIIGWFLKWSIVGLLGIFMASWAFGEKVVSILNYFRIGRLP